MGWETALINRRVFAKASTGALAAAAYGPLIASCAPTRQGADAFGARDRPFLINGNLVIPANSDQVLDAASKDLIRSSGLTAFKATVAGSGGTYEQTKAQLGAYDQVFENNPDLFTPIDRYEDLERAYERRLIGVIRSFEATTMLEADLDRIREFADRGVRVMQLGYNHSTVFGSGVLSTEPPLGLTALGRDAVAVMNAAGVALDLSHADKMTTLDAIKVSQKPVAVTHAGCYALTPHPRNKADSTLRAIADAGGVFGIFELSYLTLDQEQQTIEDYLAHLTHALNVVGEEHVSIGSDALMLAFDTGPESLARWEAHIAARQESGVAAPGEGPLPFAEGLNRPDRMLIIADALTKKGVKSRVVEKILGRNLQRWFKEAWA